MRWAFLTIICVWQYCYASMFDSIRAEEAVNFDTQTWEVNTQQCFNQSQESCKILMNIGLKNIEQCKPKNECALIGEILWYAKHNTEALPYLTKACEAKDMRGCYFLGIYESEREKFPESKEYFDTACNKKHAPSCFMVAELYAHGKAVRQDYEKASFFYKKSCKLVYPNACFMLGDLHKEGRALAHDLSLAKEFYGKACDLGMQKGCDSYRELNQAGIPSLYQGKNVLD